MYGVCGLKPSSSENDERAGRGRLHVDLEPHSRDSRQQDERTTEGSADLAQSPCSFANEPSEVADKTAATSDQSKIAIPKFKDELPITLASYIKLVDATGRLIKENKHGALNHAAPPIDLSP